MTTEQDTLARIGDMVMLKWPFTAAEFNAIWRESHRKAWRRGYNQGWERRLAVAEVDRAYAEAADEAPAFYKTGADWESEAIRTWPRRKAARLGQLEKTVRGGLDWKTFASSLLDEAFNIGILDGAQTKEDAARDEGYQAGIAAAIEALESDADDHDYGPWTAINTIRAAESAKEAPK